MKDESVLDPQQSGMLKVTCQTIRRKIYTIVLHNQQYIAYLMVKDRSITFIAKIQSTDLVVFMQDMFSLLLENGQLNSVLYLRKSL